MIWVRFASGSFAHRASSKQHINRYCMAFSPGMACSLPTHLAHTMCVFALPRISRLGTPGIDIVAEFCPPSNVLSQARHGRRSGTVHAKLLETARQVQGNCCGHSLNRGLRVVGATGQPEGWITLRNGLLAVVPVGALAV